MLRSVTSLVATIALLVPACSGSRPWPKQPQALASPVMLDHSIGTIDVLPLDLQLWAQPGYDVDLARLRPSTEDSIRNVALDALIHRSYAVGAVMDWNGDFDGGNAMAPADVEATTASLSGYGAIAAAHPRELPAPYLPARLGGATGADATLYIGGWGYVAKRPDHSTADKILEGVVIGLLVVTVVVVVLAAIGDHGGHGGGGHGGGGGGHGGSSGHSGGGGGGHGGAAVGNLNGLGGGLSGTGTGQLPGAHVSLGRHLFTSSRGDGNIHGPHVLGQVVDAFGRAAIEGAMQTDWGEDPALPDRGDKSQMYLEMTLVDNHTGLTLWHARQTFPADATNAHDTTRAAKVMLQHLPDRNAVPGTTGYTQLQ